MQGVAAAPRPNIVLIVVDDLRFDDIGAAGHPFVKTPNIDRLARDGARFLNAFATTPLCSPSRASILTGLYAHHHGIVDNTDRSAASHALATFPQRAAARGLRDGVHRQVAHGQRRDAASGLRLLGGHEGPGTGQRPAAEREREKRRRPRLRDRHLHGARARLPGAASRPALLPGARAQGASPRPAPARRRQRRPDRRRAIRGGRAPPSAVRPGPAAPSRQLCRAAARQAGPRASHREPAAARRRDGHQRRDDSRPPAHARCRGREPGTNPGRPERRRARSTTPSSC